MLEILVNYREAFINGVSMTLLLSLVVWAIGLSLGTFSGVISARKKVIRIFSVGMEYFISSMPVLVLLFWFHFPVQKLFKVVIDPYYTTIGVLGAINVFLVSSIVRHASDQIPKEYIESAKVYGLSRRKSFWRIEFPMIMRSSTSTLLTAQITVMHMTLFASLISVDELFRAAQRINSIEYRPIEIYSIIALFYLAISLPMNLVASRLKGKYSRDFSER